MKSLHNVDIYVNMFWISDAKVVYQISFQRLKQLLIQLAYLFVDTKQTYIYAIHEICARFRVDVGNPAHCH